MNKIKYTGRCHCGNIQFSFQSEKITQMLRCDCSLCVRKGALFADKYIPAEDIQLSENVNELSNYLWNDRVMNHYFCKTCGVTPYAGAPEYGYRVNLGCVEGLDPYGMELRDNDGKSMPISGDPGPHP